MQADGTILIDTKINSEGVESGTKEINASFKRTAESLQYDTKAIQKFVDEYADGLSKTAESSNEFLRTIQKLENQLKELESQGIYFGDEEYDNAYLKLEQIKQALKDYKHELVSPTPDAMIFDSSSMEGQIERLTSKLASLREQGKGFGDEAFDSAYKNLMKAQDELKAYKKELTKKEEPLQLPVSIDTSTMEGQINLLKAKLEGLRNQGKGFGDEEFDSTAQALKRAEQELTNYKNNLFKTEEQVRREAEQQERLNQKLEETAKKEREAAAEAAMLKEIGDNAQVSSPRIVQLRKELEELNARQKILEDAGVGLGNQEYDQNIQDINRIKSEMDDYRKSLLKTDDAQDQFNKSLENTEKTSKKSGNSLMRMMGTGLLMGIVFQGFYAITSAAAEGMNNLAQYSGEANATLSTLLSSLTQLKNAFATAFSPILTAIAPALNYLINLLTAAATAVAQLAAVLTGKGTFVKATKVQQDYAASLKGTGDAASSAGKDAKKSLAPFDDLVQIQQQGADTGGGGGGGTDVSPSEMFEEVAVSNTLVSALETLKGIWEEVQQLFLSGFRVGFGNTAALDTIRQSLISIRDSLRNIFTDPEVVAAAKEYAQTVIYNLGVVVGSVASVGASIGANLIGGLARYLESAQGRIKEYLINMFDISSDIATIIGNFSAAFANIFSVFGEENGQQLTANIIGIFSEAFMGLTELAAKVGRDVLDLLLTPITENQEGFKTAFDGVLQVLSTVFGELRAIVEDTFSSINQVYDTHIRPMVESFVQGLTTIYQTALHAFNEYILPVLQEAGEKFGVFREQYLQPVIDKFIEIGGPVVDAITVLWENVLVPFINWFIETFAPVIGDNLGLVIDTFFLVASVVAEIVLSILNALGSIISFLQDVFTGDWKAAWEQAKQDAKQKWNEIKNNLNQTWNNIKQNAYSKFTEIKNNIQQTWQDVKADTSTRWAEIKTDLSNTWENVRATASTKFSEVKQKISDVWQQTKQDTSEKWSNIKTDLSTTWNLLKETSSVTFEALKDGVISAWETLKSRTKEIWDGIVGIIKGCVNGVISAIEGMVNSVIDAVNWVIRQINKISIDVPDTPFSDGFTIGFDIPTLDEVSLPRLASGTVIPPRAGEFAAILGDNNRESEIVSPVSAIKQALLEAMQEAGGMSGTVQNITIRFEGSMSSLARALKPELDRETARRGTNLVIIGGR